jgi:hypothetical protein
MRNLFVLLACAALLGACAPQQASQPNAGHPSAQEILNRPLTATSLVDTHFKTSSTDDNGYQSVTEGDFLFRPHPASSSQNRTTQGPQFTTTHSEILADAVLFTRNDQQRKWRKVDRRGRPAQFAPWYAAANPSYTGEETVNGSKCWLVRADYGEQNLEAWIRESDGYPIRSRIGRVTVDYLRFNTGARVSPPPPAEVRPAAMNNTLKVGQTAHLYALDVTAVSVKPDFRYGRDFTPDPGQHFYGVQLLLKATGEDVVNVLDTQWELADSSGKRFTRTNFSTVDETQPLSSAGQQLDDTVAFNVPNGANPATVKARFGEDTLTVNLA